VSPKSHTRAIRGKMALAVLATVGVVSGGLAIGSRNDAPPPVGGNVANLWVNTSAGGSPSRCSSPCAYVAANAFGSYDAAYQAASNGDKICVNTGSYGGQQIQYKAAITAEVTIDGDCNGTSRTNVNVTQTTIGQANGSAQTRFVTMKDMSLNGAASVQAVFIYYGSNGASKLSDMADHITFDNVNICYERATTGPCFEAYSTDAVTVKNSTIGPACCGLNSGGVETNSPVGIRFGADTVTGGGFPVNSGLVIHNNLIQGLYTDCSKWLTGHGSCPQATCTDALDLCHNDGIQIWGASDMTITNNRIYHVGINGIFLDSTALMTNGTIANNMIGDILPDPRNGFGENCFDIDGRGILGTWQIINNTCDPGDVFGLSWAQTMDTNNAVWNLKGNLGTISLATTASDPNGCTAGTTGVFVYSYNTLSPDDGQDRANGCGGNETTGPATFVDGTSVAPTNTMNLALSGANGPADNKIPPATCAGFVTADIDGVSRPQDTNCEAGAWERAQP